MVFNKRNGVARDLAPEVRAMERINRLLLWRIAKIRHRSWLRSALIKESVTMTHAANRKHAGFEFVEWG